MKQIWLILVIFLVACASEPQATPTQTPEPTLTAAPTHSVANTNRVPELHPNVYSGTHGDGHPDRKRYSPAANAYADR